VAQVTRRVAAAGFTLCKTSQQPDFPVHPPNLIGLERMALDLETLREEMQSHLAKTGTPVFFGFHRMLDSLTQVSWDTERHPDFRDFLKTAEQVGAKLIVFHHATFQLNQIDEALEELEECDFTREEKRHYEARLHQLQAYEGFTCALQLSFALEGRVYLYELHTDWYDALTDILGELEAAAEEREDQEQGPISGYFSNN
jgi:hypothetical protein